MASRFDFFRESIRNLRKTGSIARSSRFLCKAMADKIDPDKAKIVVELGPGDGVISEYILDRLAPDAKLIVFEINDVFVAKIRKLFADEPRLILIHDAAENMPEHFEKLGITQVDYFISGIPFIMLPEALTIEIITKCREWLRPDGLFVQFHYSPVLLPMYKRIFGNIQTRFVPFNIPPALLITSRKMPV